MYGPKIIYAILYVLSIVRKLTVMQDILFLNYLYAHLSISRILYLCISHPESSTYTEAIHDPRRIDATQQ